MSKIFIKRGRPAGMRARQLELKQMLLGYSDIPKVTETAIRAALDDSHKNQAAAQKILMERILPICTFEKAADSREKINIAINTTRPKKKAIEGEVIE
jgi:hypothetical protein